MRKQTKRPSNDGIIITSTTSTTSSSSSSSGRCPTPSHLPPLLLRPRPAAAMAAASVRVHLFVLLGFCAQFLLADCPAQCDCKWKSGKESVICHGVNLSAVPAQLEPGTQLLDLSGNAIHAVHDDEFAAAGLVNLQRVYVARCRLKTLEPHAFRHLINLVELDLSHNLLVSVPSHSFPSVPELRELKLSGNPIQRIRDQAFADLPQLTRLELTDCRLAYVDAAAFRGLERSLKWLKLDRNRLVDVSAAAFTPLRSLHGLELAENPWNCSCALRPLREWMLSRNVPFDVPPACQQPQRLRGKPWDKLELDEFACVPEIFAYDGTAHGVEGRNVTMTCRVEGEPEPTVRWSLKNRVIANLSAGGPAGKKLYVVHLQNNSSDLTIFGAELQDAGVYVCAAENKAGRAEASVTLAVSKRAPEQALSGRAVVVGSVATGMAFALASCLIAVCVCSARKRQAAVRWRNPTASGGCRRDDNYEKIELNHKVSGGGVNGGAVQTAEVALVGGGRKNGEYRVVPGADTDQEAEEEEEQGQGHQDKVQGGHRQVMEAEPAAKVVMSPWSNSDPLEKRWNSPEHLLDPEDLHIPRRTLQEARDDSKRTFSSTCGTFSQHPPQQHRPSTSTPTGAAPPPPPAAHPLRRPQAEISGTINPLYQTTYHRELTGVHLPEEPPERRYPDLIENSHAYRVCAPPVPCRANSEGGSVSDITELFCTLPRKRGIFVNPRYRSTDSQSPLLGSSSGGDSNPAIQDASRSSSLRRLSLTDPKPHHHQPSNLNRLKGDRFSSSYVNLCREEVVQNSTPLLDVSALENRVTSGSCSREPPSPGGSGTPNANSNYDYHAAQLERFLEEYRSLQQQLAKMKETCDNLRTDRAPGANSPATPTTAVAEEAKAALKTILPISPNSNLALQDSIDFRQFENELAKYLMAHRGCMPKTVGGGDAVFND